MEIQLETAIDGSQRYTPTPSLSDFGESLEAYDRARLDESVVVVDLAAVDGRCARC
jgi:hypothetical protein